MKKINTILASSTAALLLASAPMLASAHDASVSANASVRGDSNPGLHLGSWFHVGTPTGKSDLHEERDHDHGHDTDREHDDDNDHKPMASSTRPSKDMHATVGIVTSINGSTFTIDPVGEKSTTTVSTNNATTFRVNGQATSSGALKLGSQVAIIGTSTASTSINASMVSIFSKGFGFFKHFFHAHLH